MSASFFLDSNIFVYMFDHSAQEKQKITKNLFEKAHSSQNGQISIQVLQEFTNVATRKFEVPLTFLDLQSFLLMGLRPLCKVHTDVNLIARALRIRDATEYSFCDSLIVASALSGGCSILYSEDFQHDQEIEGLVIKNPFIK